jgi:phenylalanyl-tRNA synthetase beta chain
VDFFDVKGDMEELLLLAGLDGIACYEAAQHPLLHPGQSARILIEGREAGWIGGVHPLKRKLLDLEGSVYLFELDLSILGEAPMPQFRALSRYPAVQRDLSVVVDRGVSADNVLELVRNSAGGLLKSLELFDIYTGERVEKNKKSFAFSLTFQSESSNLTSGEIDAVTAEIITTLQQSVGAELRN